MRHFRLVIDRPLAGPVLVGPGSSSKTRSAAVPPDTVQTVDLAGGSREWGIGSN
jgi:hypothetical protein